jgi:hypothetical protein
MAVLDTLAADRLLVCGRAATGTTTAKRCSPMPPTCSPRSSTNSATSWRAKIDSEGWDR